MPNKKAKARKQKRIETDVKLSKEGRTPGQIARYKRKMARRGTVTKTGFGWN